MEEIFDEIYDMDDLLVDAAENTGENAKNYTIKDDADADWAINIIKKEEAKAERLVSTIEQEIERLKIKAQRAKEAATCGFLKKILCDYYEGLDPSLIKVTKTQASYKLPSGSLVYKPETVEIVRDDEKILAYLTDKDMYEYVKTNPKVDWANLKKDLLASGTDLTTIDGITTIPKPASFDVK